MSTPKDPEGAGLSRRDALKLTGYAMGGLAVGGAMLRVPAPKPPAGKPPPTDECVDCTPSCTAEPTCGWTDTEKATHYTYFEQDLDATDPVTGDYLYHFHPFANKKDFPNTIQPLGANEMRITFMGSSIPNNIRKVQALMSIFVECGWDEDRQMPADNLIFDCGPGVVTNYNAMNVNFGRMDKIFINHLHGDHMNDVTQIYCFGPSSDRLSPLYIFGPGPSGVMGPPGYGRVKYDDGTKAYCEHLREMCRWHTESFSFQNTSYTPYHTDPRPLRERWGLPYDPKPVGTAAPPDPDNDAYAIIPIELDWRNGGVAYDNKATGVKVSYFKVIHARQGSIGYKLEFTPPGGTEGVDTLTMIYSSDTKPETLSIENAKNGGKGVDVFIHEMIVPAEIWAMKMGHLTSPAGISQAAIQRMQTVQNSSHSPQGAFGYLLSQIKPRPRLTVATHFRSPTTRSRARGRA